MAYSFNSEPRVVGARKDKYREGNLMYDSRVYRGHVHTIQNIKAAATPQEKEQAAVEHEKEIKQLEMMKTQLDAFKKSKVKQTPYDIRPAAAARIEVDLDYFLTDQKDLNPPRTTGVTQTDEFVPRPPTPKYQPKKTGMDAGTQIWDGELFDFNFEVEPILNVIVSKTLEQASLEVEEEVEFEAMAEYRKEVANKKTETKNQWEEEVLAEVKRIQDKDELLLKARAKRDKQVELVRKLQSLQLAKLYLSKLVPNTYERLYELNLFPSVKPHSFYIHYFPTLQPLTKDHIEVKMAKTEVAESLVAEASSKLVETHHEVVTKYRKSTEAEKKRLINFSETNRVLRFVYLSPEFNPRSEFNLRLDRALNGVEYSPPRTDLMLLEDVKPEESEDEEAQDPEVVKRLNKTIVADNLLNLSFSVANNPYEDTTRDQRQYTVVAELYTETGELLEHVTTAVQPKVAGVKVDASCRNKKLKTSDDERIVLYVRQLPVEVSHVIFYVRTVRSGPELKYARYSLTDYTTSQNIDSNRINRGAFSEDRSCLYLAYRLYRSEADPRGLEVVEYGGEYEVKHPEHSGSWLLDIYNLAVNKDFAELSELLKSTIKAGSDYLATIASDLASYRKKKLIEYTVYQNQLADFEAKKRKKKSKKKASKEKMPIEPAKAPVYEAEPEALPSFTVGPIKVNLKTDSVESVEAQVAEFLSPNFLSHLEDGWMLLAGHKPLSELRQLERLRPVLSLQIVARPKPEEPELSIKDECG